MYMQLIIRPRNLSYTSPQGSSDATPMHHTCEKMYQANSCAKVKHASGPGHKAIV